MFNPIIDENDIKKNIHEPHFSYIEGTIMERKGVAYSILQRDENEILLAASSGFLIDSVFSGLSAKHIEYIAKNGPKDYKDNILKLLQDQEMMQGVFEIAKAMDDDLGRGATQNQERVKNVIQYIKDNRVAFKF
jgi:hypothetical protein